MTLLWSQKHQRKISSLNTSTVWIHTSNLQQKKQRADGSILFLDTLVMPQPDSSSPQLCTEYPHIQIYTCTGGACLTQWPVNPDVCFSWIFSQKVFYITEENGIWLDKLDIT